MLVYRCDGCGRELVRGALRYRVTIDVRAAYDELEIRLADLVRDHRSELQELVRQLNEADADDVEKAIYRKMTLDLCPGCQRAYIADPLRFHPEAGRSAAVDVDRFLRSLGYGDSGHAKGD